MRRMIFPGPTRCFWPMTWSMVLGRMRSARLSGIAVLS